MRPEEKIEKEFIKEVRKIGVRTEKWEFTGKGHVDRIMLKNGKCCFIEFKAPGKLNDTSPHQDADIADLRRRGFTVGVFDSVQDALKFVKEFFRC